MGHSFYTSTSPPPKLVRSTLTDKPAAPAIATAAAVARKRNSYTPRSSGFGNGEDTPAKREYAATKDDLGALRDFLRHHEGGSAPTTMTAAAAAEGMSMEDGRRGRKDSTRRKRAWGVFSRSGGKGRRQGEEGEGEGEGLGLKNVAVRESKGGKQFKGGRKYLEIVVDAHEMHEWDESATATNQEKRLKESDGPKFETGKGAGGNSRAAGKTAEESFVLPTLDPGRGPDGFEIGLRKQIPHLDGSSRKSSPQRDPDIKMKDGRSAKMKMKPPPRHDLEPNTHDFAFNRPAVSSGAGPFSNAKPPAPLVVASDYTPAQMPPRGLPLEISNTIRESGNPTPTSKAPVSAPAPSDTQSWQRTATPKTPQHSAQNSAEFKNSPSTDRQSKAPSVLSAHGSIASDVQSDAESAIIMNAQSAEFVRARKPPKPGPAPTRALPSLPEGHDGISYATRPPNDSKQNRISIDSVSGYSPKKALPSSPTRRYRYSPIKPSVPKSATMPPKIGFTLPPERALLQSPDISQLTKSVTLLHCNDPSANDLSPTASERKQLRRTRSTKAMKTRDMERLRSRQESIDVGDSRLAGSKDEESHDGTVLLPAVNDAYDGRLSLSKTENQGYRLSNVSPRTGHDQEKVRASYELSPIIVVAEEEPTIAINANRHSGRSCSSKKRSAGKNADLNGGSEIKGARDRTSRLSLDPAERENSIDGANKPGQKANGETHSPSHPGFSEQESRQSSHAAEIEARLEARISALEKKNSLLQRLFLAVLDTSPAMGPSNSDRSSGLSATSSLFAMEAKVDALLTLVQENKRLSAEL